MKKNILYAILLSFFFLGFLGNKAQAQGTISHTISYSGFQGCGGCAVCGADYWCFNTLSSYCGNTTACGTTTFPDPVPAGNIVTGITIAYYSADCSGGSLTGTLNGNSFPVVNEGNTGCLCSNNPCSQSAPPSTGTFPCGFPGYPYGGTNTFQLCTGANVCINKLIITFTYAPASQAVPANQPGAISGPNPICPNSTNSYSIPAVGNATGYTWTVPAGWTINSGQNTTSISTTANASGGNVCVKASNLCGTSAATCMTVNLATSSTAPTSATANPSSICPGSTTTLTASGGTMGSGANYTWYSGSCGGPVVGTGSQIVVSPGSTTTYYVSIAGTCNTTGCVSTTVNMGGTQPAPGAPSGPTSVCAGSTQNYSTSGSAGATSYNWTVPAGATINSGQGTTSINVTFGSNSGNVCVDATGPCGTSSQACTAVAITPLPNTPASISGNNPLCLGSDNYSISAVPGATSYNWSVSGAGGSITGGQGTTGISANWTSPGVGTVSVTATNACGTSTAATFTVLVNPLPTLNITPTPTAVCSGSTATLTASGASTYTWTGGTTPTNGSVVTATPASTQAYNVSGTDANGCVNSTSINLTVNPTPTVSLVGSSSQVVCAGGTVNGISFTSNPPGTISWTNTNTGLGGPDLSNASGNGNIGSYTAPNVGSVTTGVVTASSNANGCLSSNGTSATFTLTINPNPVVGTASVTAAPCGQSTGCINSVNVSGGVPTYSYSYDGGSTWSASSQNCNIAAGNYPLEVIDQNGCVGTSTITVSSTNGPPAPAVSANSNNACVGDNVPLSISGSSGTYTYTWSDASGGSGTGTTYTVINIGPAGSFTVSVIANDANNCLSTPATVTVTVNPPPTGPILGGGSSNPLVECEGSTPQPVVVATTGTVTSVPVWYNGSTLVNVGTSYTPGTSTPGTTVYTVIDSATATGCKDASAGNVLTVTVTINPSPTGPILGGGSSNPLVECQNSTPQSVVVTPTGTVASVPVWYNGATLVNVGTSYTPGTSTPGTTVYTVIDSATATGCKDASAGNVLTVTVTVLAPPTAPVLTGGISNPVVECQNAGQTVTVATTGTITSIPVWYNGATWVNAGTSYTPPSSAPGTTVYTVIDSATVYGCKDASAGNVLTVTVTVNPSPTVTGNASVTGSCTQPTGSITGVNVSGGTPGYHYQWYTGSTPIAGDTLPSLTNVGAGTYSVQITDANGCPVSGGTTAFTVPSSAVVAGFTANQNLGPAPLNVSFTNTSTGATTYGWTFDGVATSTQANPSYIYNNAGTYTVVMIATNGTCTDTTMATIIVDVPTTIVIPNVFSPNGDNINEEFGIICTGMQTLTCDIFNRWGQKVYTLTAPNQTWDGRMNNGHMASEGTYFFMVNALGVDGKTYTYQGPLTLVK